MPRIAGSVVVHPAILDALEAGHVIPVTPYISECAYSSAPRPVVTVQAAPGRGKGRGGKAAASVAATPAPDNFDALPVDAAELKAQKTLLKLASALQVPPRAKLAPTAARRGARLLLCVDVCVHAAVDVPRGLCCCLPQTKTTRCKRRSDCDWTTTGLTSPSRRCGDVRVPFGGVGVGVTAMSVVAPMQQITGKWSASEKAEFMRLFAVR